MIKELAHLENRVNTHINQLNKKLHHELQNRGEHFNVELLQEFELDTLNRKKDAFYFPSMGGHSSILLN